VQRFYNESTLDRRVIKRSPSGGALHPIESYIVACRVEGVPAAVSSRSSFRFIPKP
jgi:hypothetical protein